LIFHLLLLDPGKDKVFVFFQLVFRDTLQRQLALERRVQAINEGAPLRGRWSRQSERRRHDRRRLMGVIVIGMFVAEHAAEKAVVLLLRTRILKSVRLPSKEGERLGSCASICLLLSVVDLFLKGFGFLLVGKG
jgi:hypothetical protein